MITEIRTVLLSAPYPDDENSEVKQHFAPGTHKSCAMVQITLGDGTTGLGEGYLGVFAPRVFEAIVDLLRPLLIGRSVADIRERVLDLNRACAYWSRQGAARHVISACQIAITDARAKQLGVPAYELFGGKQTQAIELYASGGDSDSPENMEKEIEEVRQLGLRLFKMRAQCHEVNRTIWTLERAGESGIRIGVDAVQSLNDSPQTVGDVVQYLEQIYERTKRRIVFLEEPLGAMDHAGHKLLRSKVSEKICGGETLTTPLEMTRHMADGVFDFVQPDATVIGGISAVLNVFDAGRTHGCPVIVHAWGGPVSLMANYHAAFAGGGAMAEYPLPEFPVRRDMMVEPLRIENGHLLPPRTPGIGVHLTDKIEQRYAFREEAIYDCTGKPQPAVSDDAWKER